MAGSEFGELERTMNFARFAPGNPEGHYESYFLRANDPRRPLAFWIRYTVFQPEGRPSDALGELWAIWFDGENGAHHALKAEVPIDRCTFARNAFDVRVDDSWLREGELQGRIPGEAEVAWRLQYRSLQPPVFLLPAKTYDRSFPRAKSIACAPVAEFQGELRVGGRSVAVENWRGSQNHNWGRRHTDHYAWGQVVGFEGDPDAFLEVATARVRMGPVWTPFMTLLVLRFGGREIVVNRPVEAVRARARFGFFWWNFSVQRGGIQVRGRIEAPAESFVGLRYKNPPGGEKHCLNSKIARCEVAVEDRRAGESVVLESPHRAAFEILTDDPRHGIELRV